MNLEKIWQKPKYLPYVQEPLTDEILRQTEEKLGYRLPIEYIELLKIQNGGYINYSLKDSPHNIIFGIGHRYSSITEFDPIEAQEYVNFDLQGLIPFDGDGHWYLCFDYRNHPENPQISFLDIENESVEILFESFNQYLHALVLDISNEIVIQNPPSMQTFLDLLSQELDIKFQEPDYFAHGYPIYMAKLFDVMFWVYPNQVPAGFIREGEREYETLKSQMQATACKYSEIAENSFLIETHDAKGADHIIQVLKQHFSQVDYVKNIVSETLL